MKICKYSNSNLEEWNQFVALSKNGFFMFDRNYMDYHKDRFIDNSLMFYDAKDNLIAILPANISNNILYSHQGLSFGGIKII